MVTLASPTGKVITLLNRRGGAGDNLTGTTFNDEAGTAVSACTAPFSGSFRPDAPLSGFDTRVPIGTWVLKVQDVAQLDTGTITALSIGIAVDPADSSRVYTFGEPDAGFTSAPVRVDGKSAVGPAPLSAASTPQLLAPPTPAAVKFVPTRVQPPADAGVTVARPTAPPPVPVTRFEFSLVSPEVFARRVSYAGFTAE